MTLLIQRPPLSSSTLRYEQNTGVFGAPVVYRVYFEILQSLENQSALAHLEGIQI